MVYCCDIVLGVNINDLIEYDNNKYSVTGFDKSFEKKMEALDFIIEKKEESSLCIHIYGDPFAACETDEHLDDNSDDNSDETVPCILGICVLSAGHSDLYDSIYLTSLLKDCEKFKKELNEIFKYVPRIGIHYVGIM